MAGFSDKAEIPVITSIVCAAEENRSPIEVTMATAETFMTAEEFGRRLDPGYPEELVQGRVVSMPVPDRKHGYVCSKATHVFGNFVEEHDLGRVLSNDSGVITERDPDTVRGADVAYYSYDRQPKGPLKTGYGLEVPELVIEVRSVHDRWRDVHDKVSEYLNAGVLSVVVLDPAPQTAHIFGADDAPRTLLAEQELTQPGILDGFAIRVAWFFE
jgi:Uma2 family endonuclease